MGDQVRETKVEKPHAIGDVGYIAGVPIPNVVPAN